MLTCYQGLVAVGKEESAVRLVHFTLREYTIPGGQNMFLGAGAY